MSAAKGQAEKDKGNAAFKAGDFPTAVGHYSAAAVADPANPTYPLNRAAAYLKLGKCVVLTGPSSVLAALTDGQKRRCGEGLRQGVDPGQEEREGDVQARPGEGRPAKARGGEG